jgi:hypothetical protein
MAIASLVRTTSLLFFLPYFLDVVIFDRNKKLFAISVLLPLFLFLPWTVRNYNIYKYPVFSNLAFGTNLAAGNRVGASGEQERYDAGDQYIKEHGYVVANKKMTRDGVNFIIGHPVDFLFLTAKKISLFFSSARPLAFWPHLSGLNKLFFIVSSALYSFILFVFGVKGMFFLYRNTREYNNKNLFFLFLSFFLLSVIPVILLVVETRYRITSYIFLSVFAAGGLFDKFAAGDKRILAVCLFVFLLNTMVDVMLNLDRVKLF